MVRNRTKCKFLYIKLIADLADGMYESGIVGIRLDLVAQRGDEPVDTAAGDEAGIAPYFIQNLVTGKRAAGPSQKQV